MYSTGLLRQYRLPNPVISIGNITMGGTGKTPLVIYAAGVLLKLGFMPSILTRGYGRSRPGETHILAPDDAAEISASTIGDEPALIRRRLPACWMGISKDRFASGSMIVDLNPRAVFLLDDGFQHRRLARNLDIVIIDGGRSLKANAVFPRGTLREPVAALNRANVIVINGESDEAASIEPEIRKVQERAAIFHCRQFIRSLSHFTHWQRLKTRSAGQALVNNTDRQAGTANRPSVYTVSAIGNPQRFRRDIQRLGFANPGGKSYPDHHWISRSDWQHCIEQARRAGADAIVTTEKDAVKIGKPIDFPLLVAEQSTEVKEAEDFKQVLKKTIEEFQ